MPTRRTPQSGQVLVLVALSLLALIGSAALVLLAGSVEWQKNQLQQLADQSALDSAMVIGTGCDPAKAATVIRRADNFLATQRTRTGVLNIAPGSCAAPYSGTDTFSGGLSATINYPYRAHQQQVEVVLTLNLPISFGGEVGRASTSVIRRAVAQQLAGSAPAVSATNLTCAAGQVNVSGSVVTQNLIGRAGTCALYAHARFDPVSRTYSDLGNVSVYADAQAWTAGGTCVRGSNAGSSRAICADGYELSGHRAPLCAAASTSYLSAGDAVINPNPCAPGKAPQPVPPVSAALPPDPNADPAAVATLRGTGGAACLAAGVYPNIRVNGVTVATGLGPVPISDASGYYHFKPSCYGYLTPPTGAAGVITRMQIGATVGPTTTTVRPTLPVASTVGTLLVVSLHAGPSVIQSTAPAGWVLAAGVNTPGEGRNEIWFYPNNPGAISNATFRMAAGNSGVAQMTEWRGVAPALPLDQTGTLSRGASATATVSTAGPTGFANELVITSDGYDPNNGQTFTPGAGWTGLRNDPANGFSSEYRLNLPAGIASETVRLTRTARWSLVIATFRPAGVVAGAVLDPGFYYFNGSGFPGGGGICLNSRILLARDVTLEFVNQAGFSSGTCAAGGGANCAAPCAFGSPPCSRQPCPPNSPADAPSNLTWFAAPCSTAPSALDAASCPGSTWCPVGDRACWNLAIWAPNSIRGQIAIRGPAAGNWLLGSIFWPGTCTYTVNGTSTTAGSINCGNLAISAAAGTAISVGGDAGLSTALVEAILVE